MQQSVDEIISCLSDSPVCHGLALQTLESFANQCRLVTEPRANYVWTAGTVPEFFAIVQSGVVRLTQRTPHGKEVVVELLGKGDCTGLLATLGNTQHPFNAYALSELTYVRVPSQAWRSLVRGHPKTLMRAVEAVVPRMLGGYGFMAFMATSEVEARLALALLRLADLNERELGPKNPMRVTRQQLADIVVTTVESAIRVTSRWQKSGVITTRHGQIRIEDKRALQSLAHLPPGFNAFSSSGVLVPITHSGEIP